MTNGPLQGVSVLDVSSVLLGPYAGLLLADLGADVIKIEPPTGDVMRAVGPHRNPGMGPIFLAANRNKRSAVLDLKDVRGRSALEHLVRQSDVLVHNVRPKGAVELGLDHERLAATNPRIISCAAYGYDERGPYAGRPAYDDTIQAMSGIASLQESFAGVPQYTGTVMADKTVSLAVVVSVLAALQHRERTGEGQAVDVSMYETMASFVLLEHLYGETFVPPLGEARYPRATSANRRPYETADGWISVVLYSDAHWQRFFALVGRSDLADDPRVTDVTVRTDHIDALYGEVITILRTRSTEEWLSVLHAADIPATPVQTPSELLRDPQLEAAGVVEELDHPSEGRIRQTRTPWSFSRTPLSNRRPAPRMGEHTREVLSAAGMAASEIDELLRAGVAVQAEGGSSGLDGDLRA